jgi:hypothetical protein
MPVSTPFTSGNKGMDGEKPALAMTVARRCRWVNTKGDRYHSFGGLALNPPRQQMRSRPLQIEDRPIRGIRDDLADIHRAPVVAGVALDIPRFAIARAAPPETG